MSTITGNGIYLITSSGSSPTPEGWGGNGLEYFFRCRFNSLSAQIHILPNGLVEVLRDSDGFSGPCLSRGAGSQLLKAETAFTARVGSLTSLGSDTSFSTGDTVCNLANNGMDWLVIATPPGATVLQNAELYFGWFYSSGSSLQRCIIKPDGTFVKHAAAKLYGYYTQDEYSMSGMTLRSVSVSPDGSRYLNCLSKSLSGNSYELIENNIDVQYQGWPIAQYTSKNHVFVSITTPVF